MVQWCSCCGTVVLFCLWCHIFLILWYSIVHISSASVLFSWWYGVVHLVVRYCSSQSTVLLFCHNVLFILLYDILHFVVLYCSSCTTVSIVQSIIQGVFMMWLKIVQWRIVRILCRICQRTVQYCLILGAKCFNLLLEYGSKSVQIRSGSTNCLSYGTGLYTE